MEVISPFTLGSIHTGGGVLSKSTNVRGEGGFSSETVRDNGSRDEQTHHASLIRHRAVHAANS